MGYEATTPKTGCASFQIAVLHSLIIPTMDGWLASEDFIHHWLALALLTNADVLSDSVIVKSLLSYLCGKHLKLWTFTLSWASDVDTSLLMFHLKSTSHLPLLILSHEPFKSSNCCPTHSAEYSQKQYKSNNMKYNCHLQTETVTL